MSSAKRLIVDVGMHRGDDTDFYLRKGFRVLAVEADPRLVEGARRRFADQIETGDLEILNIAIADRPGTVAFHSSSMEGWGSLNPERAGAVLGADVTTLTVPSDTFANMMDGRPVPYFVKVDIEGADSACIESLCTMPEPPDLVSFEADLEDPDRVTALIAQLREAGYGQFKLVNQALNPTVRCPRPPLEGRYVDMRFTHEMSGPFGEEAPGSWTDADALTRRYVEVAAQQRLRSRYATSGRILGLPLGRVHRQVRALYNWRPVASARGRYATMRGREQGGWFDVHARRR